MKSESSVSPSPLCPTAINPLSIPYWEAKRRVDAAVRAGRRPPALYVQSLEAHKAANAAWAVEAEAARTARETDAKRRERARRAACGGAFGKHSNSWC